MANEEKTKKRARRPNTPPEERKKILEKYNELVKGGMKKGEAAKQVGFSQVSLYQWQKPKKAKPTTKVKSTKKRGKPKKKRGRPKSAVKSTKKRGRPKKAKRGRPKSSVKRHRGRPKGAKSKNLSKKSFLKALERLIKRYS